MFIMVSLVTLIDGVQSHLQILIQLLMNHSTRRLSSKVWYFTFELESGDCTKEGMRLTTFVSLPQRSLKHSPRTADANMGRDDDCLTWRLAADLGGLSPEEK